MNAWLDYPDGTRAEVGPNCYIGRAPTNEIRIDSSVVSRRHAHIHTQQSASGLEFWIADLGSSNGTIRNGKRVMIPCRLVDRDVLAFGELQLVFRVDSESPLAAGTVDRIPATVVVRAKQPCWLLMVDIKQYTRLSQQLDESALGRVVGTWLRQCREAIETAGGTVDKFLGDAIFSYWNDVPGSAAQVGGALRRLRALQRARDPDFRIVLHHGLVTLEGGAGGANNLSGVEVIYVFRLEKAGAGLQTDTAVSEPARRTLEGVCAFDPVGRCSLDGFAGTHPVYRLADDPPHG